MNQAPKIAENQTTDVCEFAVFPLPDMVAFPGQTIPLHIFEPRYRKMIHDCLQSKRLLGLALPKRVISPRREPDQSHQDALNRNQATLEPVTTMGVGRVRLDEVAPDGRLYVQVDIQNVGQITKFVQDVPYFLARGEILQEMPVDETRSRHWILKLKSAYESVLESERKSYLELQDASSTESLTLAEWTYLIFKWCKMDPGFMQMVLEVRDPLLRAQILVEVLSPRTDSEEVKKGTLLPFPPT